MKTYAFTGEFALFDSNLWGGHIMVPPAIAQPFLEQKHRRIICRLPGDIVIHAALMPSKTGWFILINKSIQKKLGLLPGKTLALSIEKDDSEYGMPMPEELQWILDEDQAAFRFFEQLTPGKQRNLIHLVSSVKNQDSRIRKSLAIADHLKESQGKMDFRQLNEKIKWYNQQSRPGWLD